MKINGSKLREIRKEKHFDVREVSEKLGYSSPSALTNIESGNRGMMPNRFRKLVKILKLTEEEIEAIKTL